MLIYYRYAHLHAALRYNSHDLLALAGRSCTTVRALLPWGTAAARGEQWAYHINK